MGTEINNRFAYHKNKNQQAGLHITKIKINVIKFHFIVRKPYLLINQTH